MVVGHFGVMGGDAGDVWWLSWITLRVGGCNRVVGSEGGCWWSSGITLAYGGG